MLAKSDESELFFVLFWVGGLGKVLRWRGLGKGMVMDVVRF